MLKELIAKMSAIEVAENLSDTQMESLAGGETLKAEVRNRGLPPNIPRKMMC
mgnify:CR=1 FL=1